MACHLVAALHARLRVDWCAAHKKNLKIKAFSQNMSSFKSLISIEPLSQLERHRDTIDGTLISAERKVRRPRDFGRM
jgi:hypothetical protein